MSVSAYLASKVLTLSILAMVQAIVLSAVFFGQGGLSNGLMVRSRLGEMVVILFLTLLCATAGGLAVSAIVTSDSMALVFLPIALVAQMVLSRAFLAVESILLTLLAWLTPAFWIFPSLLSPHPMTSGVLREDVRLVPRAGLGKSAGTSGGTRLEICA